MRLRDLVKARVAVDDEDRGGLGAHRVPGRAKWNVAPWSGFAVAQSRPRCPLDDRADAGQPHAQSVRLRRVERLEQASRIVLPEADPGILDRDDCPRACGRAHDQPAPLRLDLPHGLGGIQQCRLRYDPIPTKVGWWPIPTNVG